jgi:hypothetical protein
LAIPRRPEHGLSLRVLLEPPASLLYAVSLVSRFSVASSSSLIETVKLPIRTMVSP